MSATGPAPGPHPIHQPAVDEDVAMLDEIIERIQQSLHQVADSDQTATSHLTPEQVARARKVFRGMCEDPLLNEEGDDIRLRRRPERSSEPKKTSGQRNGKKP